MKNTGKAAALLALCTFFLAGCRHRAKVAPPQAALVPALPLSTLADAFPPPDIPPTPLPEVSLPRAEPVAPRPKPRKTEHRSRRRREEVVEHPAPVVKAPVADASTPATPSDMTPIGQLSAAGGSTNTPERAAILSEIQTTQKGVNALHRPLSAHQQKTADQIETFLSKANSALNQEDLDAAHTLATKAQVLLNELTGGH